MMALALQRIGHAYFGRTVLDAVDLCVGTGEVVALVGPSGSGKSTLVHIAAGIIDPVRGKVQRSYRRPELFPETAAAVPLGQVFQQQEGVSACRSAAQHMRYLCRPGLRQQGKAPGFGSKHGLRLWPGIHFQENRALRRLQKHRFVDISATNGSTTQNSRAQKLRTSRTHSLRQHA